MNYEEYEENLLSFSRLFEEGFKKPNFKTKKFTELWYDVDVLMCREALSGPFYHVDMYYNCDYVFEGEHEWFKEIRSCEDFLNWCLSIIKLYKSKINQVDSIIPDEKEDKQIMLLQADIMEKLSFMVYDIQKDRWKFIKKPYSDNIQ
ncbi:hypothetical protein [Clostridium magnum]|uniref:Uncharacterized protein n=1 Tax=Clostridium magnum DSM 2767 TaxID=1121326 RepID=A0A161WE54_9CLOT|nr:hypothetical protein [Clostridium magnum]KZL89955.1 hypothetical protein CLMAG_44390 [Clostridium magnum DSM 2767]SHJ33104.1 hypothetical protein SAMN02745944_05773 [Clostridium magnum DSM 2767]